MLLGVLLLSERVGPIVLLGAVVVLAGSLLITGPRRRGQGSAARARHTPEVSVDPAKMGG